MKFLFKVILFMVFFNLAAFFVAYTNFFDTTIYGDITVYGDDLSNPDNLPSAETIINRIMLNGGDTVVLVPYLELELTWGVLMGSIMGITIALGAITRSPVIVTLGLISTMFLFIYNNSKNSLTAITQNMDVGAQYLVLMLGVGMLIIIVLTIMDYAAGQRSSGGG